MASGFLTISLTTSPSNFSGGLRIRYRQVGTGPYTEYIHTTAANVITIPVSDNSVLYEGTIEGICVVSGVTTYTNPTPFSSIMGGNTY
jgi:hypothetical protein